MLLGKDRFGANKERERRCGYRISGTLHEEYSHNLSSFQLHKFVLVLESTACRMWLLKVASL